MQGISESRGEGARFLSRADGMARIAISNCVCKAATGMAISNCRNAVSRARTKQAVSVSLLAHGASSSLRVQSYEEFQYVLQLSLKT